MSKKNKPKSAPVPAIPAPPASIALPGHYEQFCQLMAGGKIGVREAGEKIGLTASSGKRLSVRADIRQRIEEIKKQYGGDLTRNRVQKTLREIDIDQNDIIMGLADIARDVFASKAARVSAYLGLADIYMLRAKNIREVKDFYGWTATELREYAIAGTVPARFQLLEGSSESPAEGGTPSLRTEKGPSR